MHELFSDDNGLISKEGWQKRIDKLKSDSELKDSEDSIVGEVSRLVEKAVLDRAKDQKHIAVCFSGGLDSSLIVAILKKHNIPFTAYAVGFQDGNFKESEDIIVAKEIAKHLKLTDDEFKFKVFTLKELEPIINRTANVLKDIPECNSSDIQTVVSVSVASVEIAAHSISEKEEIFFSGLGSEEIFAGYDRHRKNPTNDECYNGLMKMYDRDLLRDSAVPKALDFEFVTPFLDEELVKYALRIPIKYKINKDINKAVLRKAAEKYLGNFSKRPKKAAQYGSRFDKAMARLAQNNKFKYRVDYLRSLTGQHL